MVYFGATMKLPKSDVEDWRTLERKWDDLEFPLREFASWWAEERAPRLFAEGGPRNARWAENAPSTVAQKGHNKPLVGRRGIVAGSLARSFRAFVSRRSSQRYQIVQGNTKPYARYHNEGRGSKGGGTDWTIEPQPPNKTLAFMGPDGSPVFTRRVRHTGYPARPFFGFTRYDYDRLNEFVRTWTRVRRPGSIFSARGATGFGR